MHRGARRWRTPLVFIAGGCLLLLLALAFRPVVQGDGVGYFSYLHAVLVRHSLDLRPEYAAAGAAGVNSDPSTLQATTPTGLAADYFPVGPALLSAPAYLGALLVGGAGQPDYGPGLVGAFALTSLLLGLLALLLCWRLTRSAVAVTATALCTPFVFYFLYEPSYSHMFSAFTVTAFVAVWWHWREDRSPVGWLALGALAGLMAITRFQDAPLAAIALLTPPPRGARARVLYAVAGGLGALLPQLAVDQAIFGTAWPQRPPGLALDAFAGHQLQVLVSSWHGLFVWHPMTLAAAAGSLLVRDRRLRAACLYALAVETLINGAAPDWWGGAAFGARRFLDLAPFWAIGLAALAARLPAAVAWAATGALAAWNALLMASLQYLIGGNADPGYAGLLGRQVEAARFLPRLVAQGEVVRDLVLWRLTGGRPEPAAGLAWLLAEAACVVAVGALLSVGRAAVLRPRSGRGVATSPVPALAPSTTRRQ
ncbi:MAG: hypothetical protein E6J41_04645 [Chloroflexi bacterium]|nr:MAG: hypothetical protein E6J41_04645 [Chloroflexota bacterium]